MHAFSQDSLFKQERMKIGVFTPLYLDSAFDATLEYTYGNSFPKFINPGLEFFEGIEMAADSLSKLGLPVDIYVYDTRSLRSPVSKIISSAEFQQLDLILGHVTASEARQLAASALKLKVPFVNVNYPNDGGITNNPYYIILNSTLNTQLHALYKFLQRKHALSDIYYLRTNSSSDERLLATFKDIEKRITGVPIKFNYVVIDANNPDAQLGKILDSNTNNIFVAGILNTETASRLIESVNNYGSSYNTTIFGMPTWDNINVDRKHHEDLQVVYGTPFYINESDSLAKNIEEEFRDKYFSRPTDMVFRGYETLLRFGRLLQQHGSNIASVIGEKKFKVFTDFDIQPVLDPKTTTLEYFENRKIYFISKAAGDLRELN